MFTRIGKHDINMAAIMAVSEDAAAKSCTVRLQGDARGEGYNFDDADYVTFKAAFDKLLTLEQVGEAMAQRQAAMDIKEAQINQMWAQVQQEAAQQAIRKGGGSIKGR